MWFDVMCGWSLEKAKVGQKSPRDKGEEGAQSSGIREELSISDHEASLVSIYIFPFDFDYRKQLYHMCSVLPYLWSKLFLFFSASYYLFICQKCEIHYKMVRL